MISHRPSVFKCLNLFLLDHIINIAEFLERSFQMFKNFNQILRGSGSRMKDGNETNEFKKNKERPGKFMSNIVFEIALNGKRMKE